MPSQTLKTLKRGAAFGAAFLTFAGAAHAQTAQDQKANQHDAALQQQSADRAAKAAGQGKSNEVVPNPARIEDSYPLDSEATRAKSSKHLQQTVVDLLSLFNDFKEATGI